MNGSPPRVRLSGAPAVLRVVLAFALFILVQACGPETSGSAQSPPVSPPPPPGTPPPPPGTPPPPPPPGTFASVDVDTTVRYQVMRGWEAHSQAGNEFPGFPAWQASLMDQAVNNLGINSPAS